MTKKKDRLVTKRSTKPRVSTIPGVPLAMDTKQIVTPRAPLTVQPENVLPLPKMVPTRRRKRAAKESTIYTNLGVVEKLEEMNQIKKEKKTIIN
jgi:hypothetical protein